MTFSDGRGHLSETETFIHKFFFWVIGNNYVINVCFYLVRKEKDKYLFSTVVHRIINYSKSNVGFCETSVVLVA
jgi:hypothetical protein